MNMELPVYAVAKYSDADVTVVRMLACSQT